MTYATIHFIRFIILGCIIAVSFFVFSGGNAQAYFTTSQSATAIDIHSALFTIDYSFGTEKHALHLPLMAHMGTEKSNTAVSYVILDEDGVVVPGKVAGFVFSSALLGKDSMYTVPKSVAEKFTLIAVFTPTTVVEGKEYRLQVTHLPFNFDGSQQLQLNPSELQYYTTKLISL